MPLTRGIARLNRVGINRVTRRVARWLPPFALLIHRGRRSGREYRTPIIAFPCHEGFVIALTYGTGTDWERNVRAAGSAELVYRRRRYTLGEPVLVGADRAGPCLPWVVRAALRLMRVDEFLQLPVTAAS